MPNGNVIDFCSRERGGVVAIPCEALDELSGRGLKLVTRLYSGCTLSRDGAAVFSITDAMRILHCGKKLAIQSFRELVEMRYIVQAEPARPGQARRWAIHPRWHEVYRLSGA